MASLHILFLAFALTLHTTSACTCDPLSFADAWNKGTPYARARVQSRQLITGSSTVAYTLLVTEVYGHCEPSLPRVQVATSSEEASCDSTNLKVDADVYIALNLDGSPTVIDNCSVKPYMKMDDDHRASVGALPTNPCRNRSYFNLQDDKRMWYMLTGGRTVGSCRIVRTEDAKCEMYALTGSGGWPKDNIGRGDGCVIAADYAKGDCKYEQERFGLTFDYIQGFCSGNGMNNAVAMMRHAITNGACGF